MIDLKNPQRPRQNPRPAEAWTVSSWRNVHRCPLLEWCPVACLEPCQEHNALDAFLQGFFRMKMDVGQNGRPRGPQMEMSSLVFTIQLLGYLILTHTQMVFFTRCSNENLEIYQFFPMNIVIFLDCFRWACGILSDFPTRDVNKCSKWRLPNNKDVTICSRFQISPMFFFLRFPDVSMQ